MFKYLHDVSMLKYLRDVSTSVTRHRTEQALRHVRKDSFSSFIGASSSYSLAPQNDSLDTRAIRD
jgi:hypothetical protein